ncbi:DNA-binding response regulator [Rhizocola hellebori]|uniref:DNA-binding response regulator n=1 Tax=Rhizocola hellebori TaxID=1392758 RepID=A0A8J3QBU3_9ACTN|nr:response regulator transcription factor [Rhizocola hellebori]GIH07983.1 DNA-binding response regulator [Rhizocola hellebori]
MTIRVLIADDHAVVRTGFSTMLRTQPDLEVVAVAADGVEAVAWCGRERVDVVLMDIRMPSLNGIEATRQLTAQPSPPKVIMLTTFDVDEYVYDALIAGASGFLLKDVTAEDLIAAVRVVAAGDALLAPSITRRLIADVVRQRPRAVRAQETLTPLTPRETEIMLLVAGGLSNAEIAGRLTISEETVKTHVGRILVKLGLRDRTQAVIYAYETGIVVPGPRRLPGSS